MEKRIVEHNLNFYIIYQDMYEPDEIFHERTNYITSNLDSDTDTYTFDNLVKKSRLLANIKNFGCTYNKSITEILEIQ
jgi:hypothetical protein